MGVGVQVWNDWGSSQIDQDHVSLALSAKGSINMTLDPATHPQPMRIGTVTVTGDNPIIAFRPSTPGIYVNLLRQSRNGNQWTFHFRALAGANFTLNYWTFDKPERALHRSDGFGFQVFRDDGSVAFDASSRPLRVVGVIDLPPPADGEGVSGRGGLARTGAVEVPTGRTYAIVQGSFCFVPVMFNDGWITSPTGEHQEELPPEGGWGEQPHDATGKMMVLETYHSGGGFNGSQIEAGLVRFEYFRGAYALGQDEHSLTYGDLMHWVVDVTNY